MSTFHPKRTLQCLSVENVRVALIVAPVKFPALYTFTAVAILAAVAGCAHDGNSPTTDLVVFGKVRTLAYEPLDDLGDSQITARITITRVLSGRPPSSVLTIKYIAHAGLTPDQEFRFHLQRSTEGIWLVCSGGEGRRGYICR